MDNKYTQHLKYVPSLARHNYHNWIYIVSDVQYVHKIMYNKDNVIKV